MDMDVESSNAGAVAIRRNGKKKVGRTSLGMDAMLRYLLFVLLAALPATSWARDAFPALKAKDFDLCPQASSCDRIAGIRVLGALQLPTQLLDNGIRFGGLSGLAWDDDDQRLYAISDRGVVFGLQPVFRNDRLVDVALISANMLVDPLTRKPVKWRRSDSEGLDILNGRNGRKGDVELVISFEGDPRIARYRPDGRFIAEVALAKSLRETKNYRYNRMLESVCVHPREGILTAPEVPMAEQDGKRLYRADGRSWRIPPGRGDIVGLECLANGDVLLLERDFQKLSLHWLSTLRRLRFPAGTALDSLLSSQTVVELDGTEYSIDNFEGLTRHRGNRFFVVSDDNNVFVQHTLLVYFELLPTSAP